MPGQIILAGGHEVRPGCEVMDREVLDAAGGDEARVVFFPTAVARYDPRGSIAGAVAYFRTLGVEARGANVLSRWDADDLELIEPIEDATLIYLGGGDPTHLLSTLEGSRAWAFALKAHARGAVLGGSSAGAMVVCDWVALHPLWTPKQVGLGLIKRAIVVPHYAADRSERALQLQKQLPEHVAVLCIPEQTGLLGSDDAWRVVGREPVTVLIGDRASSHRPGEIVSW